MIQVMSVQVKAVRLGHGGFIHTRGSSIERAWATTIGCRNRMEIFVHEKKLSKAASLTMCNCSFFSVPFDRAVPGGPSSLGYDGELRFVTADIFGKLAGRTLILSCRIDGRTDNE
jgi:hypothetical protein